MLNNKQITALCKLEKAFKACSEAGLYFYGYDTNIDWSLKTEQDWGAPACAWLNKASEEETAGALQTYGAYRGSGGM